MLHSPIAAADVGERIGGVIDIVAEPENHRVIAFVIHEGGWLGANKFLSPEDIIEYDPRALIVASADAIVPMAEIVRAEKLMKNHQHILKRKVIDESGKKIGTVINFAIETETAGIVRYYVSSMFGQERIIPTSEIVKVTKDTYVIRDETKHVRSRTTPRTAEA